MICCRSPFSSRTSQYAANQSDDSCWAVRIALLLSDQHAHLLQSQHGQPEEPDGTGFMMGGVGARKVSEAQRAQARYEVAHFNFPQRALCMGLPGDNSMVEPEMDMKVLTQSYSTMCPVCHATEATQDLPTIDARPGAAVPGICEGCSLTLCSTHTDTMWICEGSRVGRYKVRFGSRQGGPTGRPVILPRDSRMPTQWGGGPDPFTIEGPHPIVNAADLRGVPGEEVVVLIGQQTCCFCNPTASLHWRWPVSFDVAEETCKATVGKDGPVCGAQLQRPALPARNACVLRLQDGKKLEGRMVFTKICPQCHTEYLPEPFKDQGVPIYLHDKTHAYSIPLMHLIDIAAMEGMAPGTAFHMLAKSQGEPPFDKTACDAYWTFVCCFVKQDCWFVPDKKKAGCDQSLRDRLGEFAFYSVKWGLHSAILEADGCAKRAIRSKHVAFAADARPLTEYDLELLWKAYRWTMALCRQGFPISSTCILGLEEQPLLDQTTMAMWVGEATRHAQKLTRSARQGWTADIAMGDPVKALELHDKDRNFCHDTLESLRLPQVGPAVQGSGEARQGGEDDSDDEEVDPSDALEDAMEAGASNSEEVTDDVAADPTMAEFNALRGAIKHLHATEGPDAIAQHEVPADAKRAATEYMHQMQLMVDEVRQVCEGAPDAHPHLEAVTRTATELLALMQASMTNAKRAAGMEQPQYKVGQELRHRVRNQTPPQTSPNANAGVQEQLVKVVQLVPWPEQECLCEVHDQQGNVTGHLSVPWFTDRLNPRHTRVVTAQLQPRTPATKRKKPPVASKTPSKGPKLNKKKTQQVIKALHKRYRENETIKRKKGLVTGQGKKVGHKLLVEWAKAVDLPGNTRFMSKSVLQQALMQTLPKDGEDCCMKVYVKTHGYTGGTIDVVAPDCVQYIVKPILVAESALEAVDAYFYLLHPPNVYTTDNICHQVKAFKARDKERLRLDDREGSLQTATQAEKGVKVRLPFLEGQGLQMGHFALRAEAKRNGKVEEYKDSDPPSRTEPNPQTGSCVQLLLMDEPHCRGHSCELCKRRMQKLCVSLQLATLTAQEQHNRLAQKRNTYMSTLGPIPYLLGLRHWGHQQNMDINVKHLQQLRTRMQWTWHELVNEPHRWNEHGQPCVTFQAAPPQPHEDVGSTQESAQSCGRVVPADLGDYMKVKQLADTTLTEAFAGIAPQETLCDKMAQLLTEQRFDPKCASAGLQTWGVRQLCMVRDAANTHPWL